MKRVIMERVYFSKALVIFTSSILGVFSVEILRKVALTMSSIIRIK